MEVHNTGCVEFFGLPGSGKSYLLNKLKKNLNADDISVLTYEDYKKFLHGNRKRVIIRSFFTTNGFKYFCRATIFLFKSIGFPGRRWKREARAMLPTLHVD